MKDTYLKLVIRFGTRLFIFLLGLGFFACEKIETIDLLMEEQSTDTSRAINDILFVDDSTGYAVGGAVWEQGIWLLTQNGGASWQLFEEGDKMLMAIDQDEQGNIYTTGLSGQLLKLDQDDRSWKELFQVYKLFNAVDFWDEDTGVLLGGAAFQIGYLYHFNEREKTDTLIEVEHEFRDVYYISKNEVFAAGFGRIWRSEDSGKNWSLIPVQGDFFHSIHFPTPEVGYIIGNRGTILKTQDRGVHWEVLRDSRSIGVEDFPFQKIFFVNEEKGYIVGEQGLFWRTENGGIEWKQIQQAPKLDYSSIYVVNQQGWIGTKNGKIFHFVDD